MVNINTFKTQSTRSPKQRTAMERHRLGPRNADFFQDGKREGTLEKSLKQRMRAARASGVLDLSQMGLSKLARATMIEFGTQVEENEAWWAQKELFEIRLNGNVLEEIENDAFEEVVESLKVFIADCNDLEQFPCALMDLKALKKLILSNNRMKSGPSEDNVWPELVLLHLAHNEMKTVPKMIPNCNNLVRLDLSHNKIHDLGDICLPLNLEDVNLSNNELDHVHEAFFSNCSKIKLLDLSHNRIRSPMSFLFAERLSLLEILDLSHNKVSQLPQLPSCEKLDQILLGFNDLRALSGLTAERMPNLTVLELSENKLESLADDELIKLSCLKILDVSNNNLKELPFALGYMERIQIIKAVGNPLRGIRFSLLEGPTGRLKEHLRTRGEMPQSLQVSTAMSTSKMTPLQSLLWENDKIREADAAARSSTKNLNLDGILEDSSTLEILSQSYEESLINLRAIDLSSDSLVKVPAILSQKPCFFMDLLSLSLSNNALEEIQFNLFSKMERLQDLDLSRNSIRVFCEECDEVAFPALLGFNLSGNQVACLPKSLVSRKAAPKLEELDLSFNRLNSSELESWTPLFSSLKLLNLAENPMIRYLPETAIKSGLTLQLLNVENCGLKTIPNSIGQLPNLKTLLIAGNPQRLIRPDVISEGSHAVLALLRNRSSKGNRLAREEEKNVEEGRGDYERIKSMEKNIATLASRLENDLSLSSAAKQGIKMQLARERANLLRLKRSKMKHV